MKQLPLKKIFKGDGLSYNPAILTQITRSDRAAIYARSRVNEPDTIHGYEVFLIKTIEAGSPLPGGKTVAETYESYPGSTAFGKTAWFYPTEETARRRFDALNQDSAAPRNAHNLIRTPTDIILTASVMSWPAEPFSITELAAQNNIPYWQARKAVIENNLSVVSVRKTTRKPEKLYQYLKNSTRAEQE